MDDFYFVLLDKNSSLPIYQQLGDVLLDFIEKGALPPGRKLPPIRKMARQLKVNNDTVINAYKYLENKKVVYSLMGSGTYVSPIPAAPAPEIIIEQNVPLFDEEKTLDLHNAINFAGTSVSEELFPVEDFKMMFNKVLDRDRGGAFGYQDIWGYEPLREAVCRYLADYNIHCDASHIQIISGAQQGLDIIAKAILKYGDTLFVEKPTFYGASGAFLSRGSRIIEIPLDADGPDMELLENYAKLYDPKFMYVMPYYQTPTGICYSLEKKRKLLSLSEKYNFYIVEEDSVSDFNYDGKMIVPIKALDYKNRVIFIKSFSKILMPGLRLGFMVLPKKIMRKTLSANNAAGIYTPGFIQRAFELYLSSSLFAQHKQRIVKHYQYKYLLMTKALEKHFASCATMDFPGGGLSVWVRLNENIPTRLLLDALSKKNIVLSPGSLYFSGDADVPFLRLSFANVTDEQIHTGITEMKNCIHALSL